MAMRYIVRRKDSADFADLKKQVPTLDQVLDKPGDNSRREVTLRVGPERHFTFQFFTRKTGTTYQWVCPSVEIVAENETGLFAMTDILGVGRPAHLLAENNTTQK